MTLGDDRVQTADDPPVPERASFWHKITFFRFAERVGVAPIAAGFMNPTPFRDGPVQNRSLKTRTGSYRGRCGNGACFFERNEKTTGRFILYQLTESQGRLQGRNLR